MALGDFRIDYENRGEIQISYDAKLFGIRQNKLLVAWLSDRVVYDLQNEEMAEEALKVAEKKVKYMKKNENR
ncbi:hypothetical protein ES705_47399 [subsurface metagenome]